MHVRMLYYAKLKGIFNIVILILQSLDTPLIHKQFLKVYELIVDLKFLSVRAETLINVSFFLTIYLKALNIIVVLTFQLQVT